MENILPLISDIKVDNEEKSGAELYQAQIPCLFKAIFQNHHIMVSRSIFSSSKFCFSTISYPNSFRNVLFSSELQFILEQIEYNPPPQIWQKKSFY